MKAKRKPATKAKSAKMDTTDPHAEFHRQLGVAFQNQESTICDLTTMAAIADELTERNQQALAVIKLREMIEAFKRQWYADCEKAPL